MIEFEGKPPGFLSGAQVALRARHPDDIPILQAELYDDVLTRAQADSRPWQPIPPDPSLSPYAVTADTSRRRTLLGGRGC